MTSIPEFSLTAKLSNNQVKLQADSISTFRLVQDKLAKNKSNFHTFSLDSEKSLKVLLRGVPDSFSEEEVKLKLSSLGFELTFIRQFIKNSYKLPMYMVSLPYNGESKEIFKLRSLFFISIRVKAYRTSGAAQCHNCQNVGYSSTHCNHAARCVKCGGNHITKNCTKTIEEQPKCCNCEGDHTVNSLKYPSYVQQIATLQKTRKPLTIMQPVITFTHPQQPPRPPLRPLQTSLMLK